MNGAWSNFGGLSLAITNTSARIILPNTQIDDVNVLHPNPLRRMRIARISFPIGTMTLATDIVFVKFGDSTVVAAAGDIALLPNWVHHLEVPINATYIAGIASAGTATLRINFGRSIVN